MRSLNKKLLPVALVLSFFGAAPSAQAASPAIDLEVVAGAKRMDSRDWRAFENQPEVGAKLTIARRQQDRLALAVDYFESSSRRSNDQYSVYSASREAAAGMRIRFGEGRVRWTLGAGVSGLGTEFASKYGEHSTWRVRGTGVGGWCAAGVQVSAGHVLLGADARRSIGHARGDAVSVSAGGYHLGLSLGVRFGGRS